MNIANKLTLSRIIIIPIYILLFLLSFKNHYYYAVIVFILASITDFIDGYIARNKNLITSFGKFADPLADKMLVTAALLCFMSIDRISIWAVFIILARECSYRAASGCCRRRSRACCRYMGESENFFPNDRIDLFAF